MLILIINIFFIMYSEQSFDTKLTELISFITIKGNKYQQQVNHPQLNGTIYKTENKITVELPVHNLTHKKEELADFNQYFYDYMQSLMIEHYTVFAPIINSINFKLILELGNNKEIINIYYKTAFFTKSKNTIIRILPHDGITQKIDVIQFIHKKNVNIEQSKHVVANNLFGVKFDPDFVFDKSGITLIEMLSI